METLPMLNNAQGMLIDDLPLNEMHRISYILRTLHSLGSLEFRQRHWPVTPLPPTTITSQQQECKDFP